MRGSGVGGSGGGVANQRDGWFDEWEFGGYQPVSPLEAFFGRDIADMAPRPTLPLPPRRPALREAVRRGGTRHTGNDEGDGQGGMARNTGLASRATDGGPSGERDDAPARWGEPGSAAGTGARAQDATGAWFTRATAAVGRPGGQAGTWEGASVEASSAAFGAVYEALRRREVRAGRVAMVGAIGIAVACTVLDQPFL
jgi:hypothetical protein